MKHLRIFCLYFSIFASCQLGSLWQAACTGLADWQKPTCIALGCFIMMAFMVLYSHIIEDK